MCIIIIQNYRLESDVAMKKKNNHLKAKRRILLLLFVVLSLLGYLGYNVYTYTLKINKSESQKEELQDKLNLLLDQKSLLQTEITKLEDPEYVAKYAREKYLYSKDGEIIIRIIKED